MAVDAPGARSVIESVKKTKEKETALVAGFCWRYSDSRVAAFSQLHDGVDRQMSKATSPPTTPARSNPTQATMPAPPG